MTSYDRSCLVKLIIGPTGVQVILLICIISEEKDDYSVKRFNLSQGSRREVSPEPGKDDSSTFCSASCLPVVLVPFCSPPLCRPAYLVRRGSGVCGRRGDGAESGCAGQRGRSRS